MAIYAPWLADAARFTGWPVIETAGWRQRGHGGFRVIEGIAMHHTADGAGEYPSLRVVTSGRAGLAGPLANYGLGRSGTIYVIAAGVGWHAGASAWAGFRDLNDEFVGVEAESRGTVPDWTPEQRDAYPRLCAAVMHFIRRGADRVAGHKEICLPRGRKIDPAYWDVQDTRNKVAWMLGDPQHRIPRGGGPSVAPTPTDDEEDGMLAGSWAAGPMVHKVIACPVGPGYLYKQGWFSLCTGFQNARAHVWFVQTGPKGPVYLHQQHVELPKDIRWGMAIPPGTDQISVQYEAPEPVGWCIELVETAPAKDAPAPAPSKA